MKVMLIRVRLIPLLNVAPSLRRERTTYVAGLASAFNLVVTRGVKLFNLDRLSIARAATHFVNSFKSRASGATFNARINRAGSIIEWHPN